MDNHKHSDAFSYLDHAVGGITQQEADVLLCIELACRAVLYAPAGTTPAAFKFCEMYRFAAVHVRAELVRRVRRLCEDNGWDIATGTHRAALLAMERDYADSLTGRLTAREAAIHAVILTTDIRGSIYSPDPSDPVLKLYGERAGRSAETVMDAITNDQMSWICKKQAVDTPSMMCEPMFSVLYAATAEYLANHCRESAEGSDVHVDLWLADHAGEKWQFAPYADGGEWFVSVDDALYTGIEEATDGTAPAELYINYAWEGVWFVGDDFGNVAYTAGALANTTAVDALITRAAEMMEQLDADGVQVARVD